jgi:putative addiction module CopG family antidote
MNVELTPDQRAFVQRAIESGRFSGEEEAVQEALALWEERERRRLTIPKDRPIPGPATRAHRLNGTITSMEDAPRLNQKALEKSLGGRVCCTTPDLSRFTA